MPIVAAECATSSWSALLDDRDDEPERTLCARCRRIGAPTCRACKPSGLEACAQCGATVSLLPRGDVPQAWTETVVYLGSRGGPRQILYYCRPCAVDPVTKIPEEGAVICRPRPDDEIMLPGFAQGQ